MLKSQMTVTAVTGSSQSHYTAADTNINYFPAPQVTFCFVILRGIEIHVSIKASMTSGLQASTLYLLYLFCHFHKLVIDTSQGLQVNSKW